MRKHCIQTDEDTDISYLSFIAVNENWMVRHVEDGAKGCEHVALWDGDKRILVRINLDLKVLDTVVDHEFDMLRRVLPVYESAAND